MKRPPSGPRPGVPTLSFRVSIGKDDCSFFASETELGARPASAMSCCRLAPLSRSAHLITESAYPPFRMTAIGDNGVTMEVNGPRSESPWDSPSGHRFTCLAAPGELLPWTAWDVSSPRVITTTLGTVPFVLQGFLMLRIWYLGASCPIRHCHPPKSSCLTGTTNRWSPALPTAGNRGG